MVLICHDGVSLSSKDLDRIMRSKSVNCEQRSNGFRILLKTTLGRDLELVFGRCFITCRKVGEKETALPAYPLELSRRIYITNMLKSAIRKEQRKVLIKRLRRGELNGYQF